MLLPGPGPARCAPAHAAQVADVLVASHSGVGYHSFVMREGSSLVEVLPLGFATSLALASASYAKMLGAEKRVRLRVCA